MTQSDRPRVLVVEDEIFVALDLAATLNDLGYHVLGPVATAEAALALAQAEHPDAALLDVNLGRGRTAEAIAAHLRAAGVPFAFMTAYRRDSVKFILDTDPVFEKPVSRRLLPSVFESVGLAFH